MSNRYIPFLLSSNFQGLKLLSYDPVFLSKTKKFFFMDNLTDDMILQNMKKSQCGYLFNDSGFCKKYLEIFKEQSDEVKSLTASHIHKKRTILDNHQIVGYNEDFHKVLLYISTDYQEEMCVNDFVKIYKVKPYLVSQNRRYRVDKTIYFDAYNGNTYTLKK